MNLACWIACFAVGSFFWAWVLFHDGAERLEGSFLAGLFFWEGAPRWSMHGIRVFGAGMWIVQSVWFVAGLFSPAIRLGG